MDELEIDELDLKILQILYEDSRIAFTEIARILDVPDTTVHFRVKKMKKQGIISRFTINIPPQKLGFEHMALLIIDLEELAIPAISKKRTEDFCVKFAEEKEIRFVALDESGSKIVMMTIGKTMEEIEEFITGIRKIPDVESVKVEKLIKIFKGLEFTIPPLKEKEILISKET